MPEIKNQFTGGKMNKDVDERLVPKGEYTDAMNIQVSTSEGSDVGTIQNILGNFSGCENIDWSQHPTSSFTVGSIADEKNDSLYWFVSGQPYSLGSALGYIDDWNQFTALTDTIWRRSPSEYVGGSYHNTFSKCEPVFVDNFAFTVVTPDVDSGGIDSISGFPTDLSSQMEPGWTITGISTDGTTSNTVEVSAVGTSPAVPANYGGFNITMGNRFVVPLVTSPSGAASMPIHSNVLYLSNPPSGITLGDLVGETIDLFATGHPDYQSNQIQSASYATITFDSGISDTYLKLIMLNNVVPFVDPASFSVLFKASGDALGSSYQGSIIWGSLISTITVPGLVIPIPYNVITVDIGDLDVNAELTLGDPIAFGNSSGCVGAIGLSGGNNFTVVDCATATPIAVPVGGFPITLPLETVINLDSTLYLNAAHTTLILSKPRVLNFNHDEYVTGINIIDDMLFWTDGRTEPKKINISRSIEGTNHLGLEHTRLINTAQGISLSSNILAREEHITVIRKAPLKAPFLEMKTSEREGVVSGGDVIASGTGFVFDGKLAGDQVDIVISNIGGVPPDFKVGDILRLGMELSDLPDNYELRVSIVEITQGINATTYVVRIESTTGIGAIGTVQDWFVELEEGGALFERKLPRFAYRYKYEDNEYSSFSPFTEVAFVPGKFNYEPIKAYNTGMINQVKSLVIKDFIPASMPLDVAQVDILYKNEVSPTVYLLKSVSSTDNVLSGETQNQWNSPGSTDFPGADKGAYKVSSENISYALPSSQNLRVWDNVPKKAQAQEVSGNRVVYANYEIGYDAIQPQITTSLNSRMTEANNFVARKSIKSLRDYDIGVVWGDEYGRETPVKTAGNSVIVDKSQAGHSNYLKATLKNSPSWAKYYRFYVKETANEYYNLAMDRWYDAGDGNIWVSFPSVDRNKVDEDTYIILKKGTDKDLLVEEEAKYKIVAIENEAPEFIKTSYERLLRTNTDDSRPSHSCNLWGGSIPGSTCNNLNAGKNAPKPGRKGFSINSKFWSTNAYSLIHTITSPLGMQLMSPKLLLEEVSGNTSGSTTDELYVSFSRETSTTGSTPIIKKSKKYHVVDVNDDELGAAGTNYYYISLDAQIDADDEWVTGSGQGGAEMFDDDIHVHFWKKTIINKPEFDGRFFVKILFDQTAEDHVRGKGLSINKNLTTKISTPLYKISDDALTLDGSNHAFNATVSHISAPTAVTTNSKAEWEAMLKFGGSVTTANWFVDNATFASKQMGTFPSNGMMDHQQVQYGFSDPSGGNRHSYDHFSSVQQTYTTSGCTFSANPSPLSRMRDLGTGKSNGQVGMKGVHSYLNEKFIDISYSKLGPDGSAVGGDGKEANGTVDWRVGEIGNSSTDQEMLVISSLKQNELFKLAGSDIIYKILQINKFRLFNYQGRNTADDMSFNYPPSWSLSPYTAVAAAYINANCPAFWNQQHITQLKDMQRATNRRFTYRIKYEVDLEYSPDSTTVTSIDDTGEPYHDISNIANSPTTATPVVIEFLTPYSTEGSNPISTNPAIFETEPKEDIDIDIYYEASSSIPTFPLTNKNKYSFIPIGGTLVNPMVSLSTSFPTGVFVTSWGDINPFNPVYQIDLSVPFTPTQFNAFAMQSISYIEKDNGELVSFKVISGPIIGGYVSSFIIEPKKEVGLNWSNCWSFGNGVESNRIGDTYNKPYVNNGATASASTEETKETEVRKYGLIYSGIYNSTSSVNNLNQFIAAEKITKDINPIYGSIQKLHAGWGQGGDLVALCEDRILKILANKDALFNADGDTNITSTNLVLGTAIPYSGEHGISNNPESFASEAYRIYFTDKVRGTVMRLSMDGLTAISAHGMKDWFKDNLKLSTKLIGSYDDKKEEYNITLIKPQTSDGNKTVTFREDAKGWVSFKSFTPENAISCANEYYTFSNGRIWKHHVEQFNSHGVENARNTFYNVFNSNNYSTFNTVLNDAPGSVKSFNTINYEGSTSRVVQDLSEGEQYYNLAAKPGWYVDSISTNKEQGSLEEFIEKEGKWFNYIKGKEIQHSSSGRVFVNPDGSSTFDQASFAIQGIGRLNSQPLVVDVLGCTDSSAFNYNSDAQTNDNSCIPYIYGCWWPTATNYDATANSDSGSCYWEGCTCDSGSLYPNGCTNASIFDSAALNYQYGPIPQGYSIPGPGIVDDGSCIAIVYGCTNPLSTTNYDSSANTDDGSCVVTVSGCMTQTSPSAFNYDASVNFDDGTCIWYGCTDNTANNYSFYGGYGAIVNAYVAASSAYGIQPEIGGSGINALNPSCTYDYGCTESSALNYDSTASVDDGSCTYPGYGCTNSLANNYDPSASYDDGSCNYDTYGCTDCSATNYDATASYDDGSCNYDVDGCTDCSATNYNSSATIDDGSCTYVEGCMDTSAQNYNCSATIDDGTCTYVGYPVEGCTDCSADNYDSSANTDDGSCTYPLAIGDNHQGGIIFYLDGNGGGLIAAHSDQGQASWGCSGTTISGADGMAIGTGSQNTIDIEAGCSTSGIAADLCANLTLSGYSDWFLPSTDELDEMYRNIGGGAPMITNTAGISLLNIGGFGSTAYWSSSEFGPYSAMSQYLNGGLITQSTKYNTNRVVRAIRAF